MNVTNKAINKLVNPPRVSNPDRLRAAVSGQTVLVTGASYGVGEATARQLAAAGATVLLLARSADKLYDLVASITAGGERAVAYPADLSDPGAVTAVAKRILDDHGPLDVVVSNAGKSMRRSLHEQYDRPQDFQRTIDVNYRDRSAVFAIREAEHRDKLRLLSSQPARPRSAESASVGR